MRLAWDRPSLRLDSADTRLVAASPLNVIELANQFAVPFIAFPLCLVGAIQCPENGGNSAEDGGAESDDEEDV